MMRSYLYILAGITSALIGWNLGQVFLTDLGLLKTSPQLILFPCIGVALSVAMVFTEIFVSTPTRPKLCWRIALFPLSIAAGLGIFFGLISGGIAHIFLLPQIRFDARILRIVCWLCIGASTGIAEGVTWRWHSTEAGDAKRFWQRFQTSVVASVAASLAAVLILEILGQIGVFSGVLEGVEDPLGFSILGMLLGFGLSRSTSPSYMAALRAGTGFEYTGENYDDRFGSSNIAPAYPAIDKQQAKLKFVSDSESDKIEEGLSIQLPEKGIIRIGSAPKANIQIPGLPLHVADLEMKAREAILKPNPKSYGSIAVNGNRLDSRDNISLKHNYLLTFYPEDEYTTNGQKFYRFVYYNRFLDPQA
ncbi:hypothetical protein [Microcoleus anatoxicus]|uniref:hypothetical protein n=1 Tax=Microcoleus anatoxicus TaxID=2705319 RepID=UPI0030C8DC8E